jgi:hypothetical protein
LCDILRKQANRQMEYQKFIENLSQNNANYNNPEQAITTANLCNTISRDINTDSQRFIYELLQNADDASNQSGKLDIQINFVGDYVVISHKGEAFSKIDIESISSAGDGTKTGDTNKTGFKGIGFKSVFSHSNFVIIKSGNFCFKFDKNAWKEHWNNTWGSKSAWQSERQVKQKDTELKMPWQIIPIWAELPTELTNLAVFQNFNVSTIIKYDKVESLQTELSKLFSDSQIVLFLRSKEVKITVNSNEKFTIEKIQQGETTKLKRNDTELSEWLIKTEVFDIPQEVQKAIIADDKSPKKLKEATRTEISFAIQLENVKLKAVDRENRLIFTYLPTSINYDFPFLVNASFLTDAGRQNLHQDVFWNKWLFGQIAIKYFSWISELANKNSKYSKQILSIIPHKLNSSEHLKSCFDNGLQDEEYKNKDWKFKGGFIQAIDNIAFVPNLNGDLLRVSETIFDKTNISDFISKQTVVNYINSETKKQFSVSSFVPYIESLNKLKDLGMQVFNIEDLERFFASDIFAKEHTLDENFKLISFLYEQAEKAKDTEGKSIWNEKLRNTPFIFDENQELRSPKHIYFPAVAFSDEFSDDLKIIHPNIVSKINENRDIRRWLDFLGVKEPSDISFIEKTIIAQLGIYITKENALQIGRYLFNAHKKGVLREEHYKKLQHLKILTKQNNLILVNEAYFSDFYEPEFKLEKLFNADIYISEAYYIHNELKEYWISFWKELGIKQKLMWETVDIKEWGGVDSLYFDTFRKDLDKYKDTNKYKTYSSYTGGWYSFSLTSFNVNRISFQNSIIGNYSKAKFFWDYVLNKGEPYNELSALKQHLRTTYNGSGWEEIVETKNKSDYAYGTTGGGYYFRYKQPSYFQWTINNLPLFPTTSGKCLKASEVFNNNIPQINELAGKYLPVFDYSDAVPPEWLELFKFKPNLEFENYLEILTKIWQDNNLSEEEQKENQKRIGLIYDKLASMTLHSSQKEKIKEWGEINKLLAKNGTDFFYPKDLQLVTISGFDKSTLAFADENNTNIVELLRLFGVTIINKVTKHIPNSTIEIGDLKHKLSQVSPLVALVAVEKSKSKKEWETEFYRITNKLKDIRFFQTSEIYLSYGDNEGKQKRSSWAEEKEFYYVGNWYSPRVLDGLIEPLGKFLNIRYAERILTVLLLENFASGVEYLKEKGYDISLIPDELLNPKEPEPEREGGEGGTSTTETLGKKGELFVYEELKRIYTKKYGQSIEETKTGFKIGSNLEVFWRNISENTTTNHDFKVVEFGKEIYIDSKATLYAKNVEKVALYISGNELELMETAEKYLIARVFNVKTKPEMELIKLEISRLSV